MPTLCVAQQYRLFHMKLRWTVTLQREPNVTTVMLDLRQHRSIVVTAMLGQALDHHTKQVPLDELSKQAIMTVLDRARHLVSEWQLVLVVF